jgi:hypothetical protein
MENCLVTKLKGVVDNNNLPILGKMLVVVSTNDPSFKFNKSATVKVLGGTVNGQTEISINAGIDLLILSSTIVSDGTYGEGKVGLLIDKYDLTNMQRIQKFDLEDILYSPFAFLQVLPSTIIENVEKFPVLCKKQEFIGLNSSSSNIAFDVTELGSNGVMTDIRLVGNKAAYGSLDKAGMSPLTSNFSTPNTKNVSLNIETFVGYHRAAGRTTGSMSIQYLGACNCTFNGESVTNQADNSLSWTATTITLNGVTIDA